MKRGTTDNPKFRRLCRRLGLEPWGAAGLLELLWHFTAKTAPRGDIGRWTDEDIADGLGWSGSATDLIAALVSEGWVDTCTLNRLVVHDWPEHADDAIHLAVGRAGDVFADGTAPKLTRLKADERKEIEDKIRAHKKRTRSARRGHGKRTDSAPPSTPLPSLAPPPTAPPSALLPRQAREKDSGASASLAPAASNGKHDERTPGSVAWETGYAPAYRERYGVEPTRNAKTNSAMAQLVKRIGVDDAPHVAVHYLGSNAALYVNAGHCVDLLVRDAEKLRTEWATGRSVNAVQARRNERTAANPALALVREQRERAAQLGITPEELEQRERAAGGRKP